jgi:hypothetical protein
VVAFVLSLYRKSPGFFSLLKVETFVLLMNLSTGSLDRLNPSGAPRRDAWDVIGFAEIGLIGIGMVVYLGFFFLHGNDSYKLSTTDIAFQAECVVGHGSLQWVEHTVSRPGSITLSPGQTTFSNYLPTCVGGTHAGYVENAALSQKHVNRPQEDAISSFSRTCAAGGGSYAIKIIWTDHAFRTDPDMVSVDVPSCVGGKSDQTILSNIVVSQTDVSGGLNRSFDTNLSVLPTEAVPEVHYSYRYWY